jgi:2-polyprenyl-6-hydroxyphenyl methylase/3-demethylubiquinone-9 3-methyltransferase
MQGVVMSAPDLLDAESHFEFGKNWSDYSRNIDEEAIREAERGVLKLVPAEALKGASWLDIGSGSGLHSLAAHRLGAGEITAIDIDADSVETTRKVLAQHGVKARIERMSVFEMDSLGQYDIVYSWGVLHHTGAMWRAIESAAKHVKPGGLFAIALYQKTPFCGAWTVEKRIYTKSPEFLRRAWQGVFGTALLAAMGIKGRNPVDYVRNYKSTRGMSYWHDVHDWLGGYPYESSTPEETRDFVCKLGFEPLQIGDLKPGIGLFGTGCAEYVFRKKKG